MVDGQSQRGVTASEAGLTRAQQLSIVLRTITEKGGVAEIGDIYAAVEEQLRGKRLSTQGRATLREVVNRHAVQKGYVHPHDPRRPGWRITSEGQRFVESERPSTAEAALNSARTAVRPLGPPINVEAEDLTDQEIDEAIGANALRIGLVDTGTESRLIRQRRGQQRLRDLALLNYSTMCAVCDVTDRALLVTSHIVGWAELPEARGVLSNVICLCTFHDALFERGYWSLSDNLVILRRSESASRTVSLLLGEARFRPPHRHTPHRLFLRWHRLRSHFDASK